MTTPKQDFRQFPDIASRLLGGTVMWASDDFYADVHQLIAPGPAVHDPAAFGPRGKLYDGWETRRRRDSLGEHGDDFVVIRLAVPAIIRGVNIDTAFFSGNFPSAVSVEATTLLGYPDVSEVLAASWEPLLDKAELEGNTANLFAIDAPERLATHLRLTIHPDGGVARLNVFGEVVPDPRYLGGRVDLAALLAGGLVDSCSNMFYSSPANVLRPGFAHIMSDGWETARRRHDGNEWLTVRLASPAVLHEIVIDTSRFVGNAPGWASITDADDDMTLLGPTRLSADTVHRFRVPSHDPVERVRLDILPDGGISRLRMRGVIPTDLHEVVAQRWLGLLPAHVAAQVDRSEFFA